MLARVGSAKDTTAGQMSVYDVGGAQMNVTSANGHLYAFDDACTHTGCSLAKASWTARS